MNFRQCLNLSARKFLLWITNDPQRLQGLSPAQLRRLDPTRVFFFIALHIGCFAVVWVGVSAWALGAMLISYAMRMFFITAFFHRYFSHRAFKAGRVMQFLMGFAGCTAAQRGPVWWAGHHREHHASADTPDDPHSPHYNGFWHSHTLWFLTRGSFATPSHRVRDWTAFPELRWLERFDILPVIVYAACWYAFGELLAAYYPTSNTGGWQMVVWAALISSVLLYHATYSINSLAHQFGTRHYATNDHSRNNLWLALLTLGEGWHNNHHRYPSSARQGFLWWEVDLSFYGLNLLKALGLVHDLKPVPVEVLRERAG